MNTLILILTKLLTMNAKANFVLKKNTFLFLQKRRKFHLSSGAHKKSVAEGMEGLCMLLKTFAYPCRYADMVSRFGRPVPVICMVTNWFLDFVYDKHGHRILQWNDDILNPRSIQEYVNAITRKEAALDNCFGFIHGTVRPISRPGTNQRLLCNGHKRVPAIKFLSLHFQMVSLQICLTQSGFWSCWFC